MRKSERSQRRWQQRIEAQQSSGLSVSEFCQREGIGRAGFYYWKRRLKQIVTNGFVELKVDSAREIVAKVASPKAESAPVIELRLENGRALMVPVGFDTDHLAKLIATLEVIG